MLTGRLGFNSIKKLLSIYCVQGRERANGEEGRVGANTKKNKMRGPFFLGTTHLII